MTKSQSIYIYILYIFGLYIYIFTKIYFQCVTPQKINFFSGMDSNYIFHV